jgi:hypothetical protein
MPTQIAASNLSFAFLRNSSDFLNIILSEISSCILLLNKDMMLVAYNDPLKTIFSDKEEHDILFKKCGEVIGCAYSVEEGMECGSTSFCQFCELRESAIETYLTRKPYHKKRLSREFYRTTTTKEMKHLQFSTRFFQFDDEGYVMVIIDDVTDLVDAQDALHKTGKA